MSHPDRLDLNLLETFAAITEEPSIFLLLCARRSWRWDLPVTSKISGKYAFTWGSFPWTHLLPHVNHSLAAALNTLPGANNEMLKIKCKSLSLFFALHAQDSVGAHKSSPKSFRLALTFMRIQRMSQVRRKNNGTYLVL